jgi:hypothetical protein
VRLSVSLLWHTVCKSVSTLHLQVIPVRKYVFFACFSFRKHRCICASHKHKCGNQGVVSLIPDVVLWMLRTEGKSFIHVAKRTTIPRRPVGLCDRVVSVSVCVPARVCVHFNCPSSWPIYRLFVIEFAAFEVAPTVRILYLIIGNGNTTDAPTCDARAALTPFNLGSWNDVL